MRIILFLIINIFFTSFSTKGQENEVHLTVRSEYLSSTDTLELYIWHDLIGNEYQAPYDIVEMPMNDSGTYHTVITGMHHSVLISMNLPYQKKKGIPTNGIFRLLRLEPGDNITIDLVPQQGRYRPLGGGYDNGEPVFLQNWKPLFVGVGSERVRVQYILRQMFTMIVDELDTASKEIEWVSKSWSILDSAAQDAKDRLEEGLSSSVEADIYREIQSWCLYSKMKVLERYYTSSIVRDESLNKAFFSEFLTRWVKDINLLPQETLLQLSYDPKILDACTAVAYLMTISRAPNCDLSDVVKTIKECYVTKTLRDRIVTALLLERFSQHPDNELLGNAILSIEDKYALTRLSELGIFEKGALFPEFNLPDLDGKYHNLSDYRGKTILIDFWYMACIPCRVFIEKELKHLAERYKGDSEIVIIMISLDDRKTLNQANEGQVIPQGVVTLYTDDLRFKHPYIEKLGIRAYPFPVLLDGMGRVVLTGNKLVGDNLIDLIEEQKNSGN